MSLTPTASETHFHFERSIMGAGICDGERGGEDRVRSVCEAAQGTAQRRTDVIHPAVITPGAHLAYDAAGMSKATLFRSDHVLVGLNGFEPGQEHRLHAHAGMDKLYVVLSGRGVVLLEGREEPIETGQVLVAPEGIAHGLRNSGTERLLVLAVLTPAPAGR
jgi:mannose-6-phosphate isomerase-like protein (cupin superfamily)